MSRIKERIENFNKSFDIYVEAVNEFDKNRKLSHMALIQTFEICYELAWKILKDYLFLKGIVTQFPREAIKEAFSTEVIKDGQTWIDMLETRNLTSHEYNMDKVDTMLDKICTLFFEELNKFYNFVNDKKFLEGLDD